MNKENNVEGMPISGSSTANLSASLKVKIDLTNNENTERTDLDNEREEEKDTLSDLDDTKGEVDRYE